MNSTHQGSSEVCETGMYEYRTDIVHNNDSQNYRCLITGMTKQSAHTVLFLYSSFLMPFQHAGFYTDFQNREIIMFGSIPKLGQCGL